MMLTGFEKIVEERIRNAQRCGEFDNLPGSGKPLKKEDVNIPEELRTAYKMLKNAGYLPPEIEIKKEIQQMEDMLASITDVEQKYRAMKRLNFLILKLNSIRNSTVNFEMPQKYMEKITDLIESEHRRA